MSLTDNYLASKNKTNGTVNTTQPTQPSYQSSSGLAANYLAAQNQRPQEWSVRKVLGNINNYMKVDPDKANKMFNDLMYLQTKPTSKYYNPYSQPTNRAVSNLNAYGVDTSVIDDNFFAQNDYLRQYLTYDGTTNTPSKPSKKASAEQKAAYEFYQIWKAEDATKKAETEWNSLQKELSYWAQRTDRNYSDQEILDKIDWSKYGELVKMDENKKFQPNEYNRAIGYSRDAMYGVIWAARNPEYHGDLYGAMANSYLGDGNVWKQNDEVASKLAFGTDTYSPYSLGSTMEEEGLYFGMFSFDQDWINEHRQEILSGSDETAKKYFNNVLKAEEYTQKLESELTTMQDDIQVMLQDGFTDPDKILDLLKDGTNDYSDLFALDDTLSSGDLKATTRAVNYRWQDIEDSVRRACEKSKEVLESYGIVTDLTERPDMTDAEKKLNEAYKMAIEQILPSLRASGTKEEQEAAATGKTPNFDQEQEEITSASVEVEKIMQEATSLAVNEYLAASQNIWDYEQHQQAQSAAQAEIDKFSVELADLRDKRAKADSIGNLDETQIMSLQNLAYGGNQYDEDWQWAKGILSSENSQDPDDVSNALGILYQRVTGFDMAIQLDFPAEMMEQAQTWWEIISEAEQPIQKMVDDANRTASDVDDYEDVIGDWEIRLEKNENGEFEFSSAVNTATGDVYNADAVGMGEAAAAEAMMGTHLDLTTMTEEEYRRLGDLEDNESKQKQIIEEEQNWLDLNESIYVDSKNDQQYIMDAYVQAALASGGEMDSSLLPTLEYGFKVSQNYEPTRWTAYSTYEMAEQEGDLSHEEAVQTATSSIPLMQQELSMLNGIIQEFESYGVEMSDDQKKNIQRRIDFLNRESKATAYYILDTVPDFEEKSSAGLEKAKNSKDPIAKQIAGVHDDLPIKNIRMSMSSSPFIPADIQRENDRDRAIGVMSDAEKNRYLYLLETEGLDKANDYFKMLSDPEYGVLTVRASEELKNDIRESASQDGWSAALATLVSFGTNVVGGPAALIYEANQVLQGKEVNPHASAFTLQNVTESSREGAKQWIDTTFGGSKFATMVYDAVTSHIDSTINAMLVGGALDVVGELFSATKLGRFFTDIVDAKALTEAGINVKGNGVASNIGSWLGSGSFSGKLGNFAVRVTSDLAHASTMGLNAASAAYRDAVIRGASQDQALGMFMATFWAETGSEAITFDNLHDSFVLGGDKGKDGLVAFVKDLFKDGAGEFFGEGINEYIEQNADRIIMGSMSEYDSIVKSYTDQGYPEAVAKQLANNQCWKNILEAGAVGFMSSAGGNVVRYTAGSVSNVIEDRNERREERKKDIPGSNGAITQDDVNTYTGQRRTRSGFDNSGEGATAEQVLSERGPRNTALYNNMGKDFTVLSSAWKADSTGASVAIASVLDTGSPSASKAASKKIVADLFHGKTKNAALGMQQIFKLAYSEETKSDITHAALTEGQGHEALVALASKVNSGQKITAEDVNAIHVGIQNDKAANPTGFAQAYAQAINSSMVADRTVQIARERGEIAKSEENVKEKNKALKKATEELEQAQSDLEAGVQNAIDAIDDLLETADKNENGPVEQNFNEVEGQKRKVTEKKKKAEEAKQAVIEAKKKLDQDRAKELGVARATAMLEIGQATNDSESAAYNQAITTLPPMKAFGSSIPTYDAQGREVRLTGIYDVWGRTEITSDRVDDNGQPNNSFDDTIIYTTEDGRLVAENAGDDRRYGDVSAHAGNRVIINTQNAIETMNRTRSTPAVRPRIYFPSSFTIDINGTPVHMIGIAGKVEFGNITAPVLMDINGNLYNSEDPSVQIPQDIAYNIVNSSFEDSEGYLPLMENIPNVEVTNENTAQNEAEANNNVGSEEMGEPNQNAEIPVQGTEGEGYHARKLATAPGQSDGRGSNGVSGYGTQEGPSGRSEEGSPVDNGQAMGRRNEGFRNIIGERLQEGQYANDPHLQETDYGRFSSALDTAKANSSHGLFVDAQTPEDLREKGAITMLSEDGMAGVAVETKGKDKGNIVGVFNNSKGTVKHTMPYLMVSAIDKGGNKLDCYDGFLSRSYETYGFIPVAKVRWNDMYHQDDGWNYERDGRPDIIVWMHNGDSAETVARKYNFTEAEGGYHRFTDKEMDALPYFDDVVGKNGEVEYGYDRALAYRDNLLAQRDRGAGLLYTHALSVDHAMTGVKEGGFPGISVAVIRAGQKTEAYDFGTTNKKGQKPDNVIGILSERSVDPESDSRNLLLGDDAFSFRFPENIAYGENGFYDKNTGKPVTRDDIVKIMFKDGAISEGITKVYKTLRDMKNDSGRLTPEGSEALHAVYSLDVLDGAASTLFSELTGESKARFQEIDDLSDTLSSNIHKIYQEGMTDSEMQSALSTLGIEVSEEAAGKYKDAVKKATDELTSYFEAKLMRDVSLSEFRGFVIPEGATELAQMLEAKGIPFLTHDGTNRRARTEELARLLNATESRTKLDRNGEPIITPKSDIHALKMGERPQTPTEKQAKKTKVKLKSPQQIAQTLVKSLGFGNYIGSKKFGTQSNAEGYWSDHARLLAVKPKYMGEYTTTFHEIGHGIAQKLGLVGTQQMIDKMVKEDSRFTQYAPNELKDEAMAEFTWRYMESEQRARDFAGDSFYDMFERELYKNPYMAKAVSEARDQMQRWMNANDDERFQAMVRWERSGNGQGLKAAIRTVINELADSSSVAEEVNKFIRDVKGVQKLDFSDDLRAQSLMANHSQKRALMNLTDFLTDTNGTRIGDGMAKRMKDAGFSGTPEDIKLFEEYALLLHSFSRDEQAKKVFPSDYTEQERQARLDEIIASRPDIVAAEKAWQSFRHDFMQEWMVNTGYWSQELLDHLEKIYPHYVPTFRIKDEGEMKQLGGGRSAKKFSLHEAIGSSQDIYSPYYSIIGMVDQIVGMVETNQIAKTFDKLYRENEGMGIFGRLIPGSEEETAMTPSGELNSRQQQLLDALSGKIGDDLMERVLDITKSNPGVKQSNDSGLLRVQRDDGKVVSYEIDNPELYKLLTGAHGTSGIRVLQLFGQLTRTMSMLTTGSNPLFAMRNAVRDYQNSVNYGSWASNYITGIPKWIKSFYEVWKESEAYKDYEALGGGGWTRIQQGNNKSLSQVREEMFGDDKSTVGKTAKWAGKKLWDTITMARLNEIIEQTSRFAEYKYGKNDLSTSEGRQQAFLAAQDATVDFSRSGNSELAYILKKVVPFFNASMQGVYRTGRQFTEAERGVAGENIGETLKNVKDSRAATRLTKTIVNTALASALASALVFKFGDDDDKEEYMMLSDGIKANHLILPNPLNGQEGQPPFLRIPLAQDPVTYAVHGLVTNAMANGSDDEMAISLAATADVIMDNLNPLGSGTIAQPVIDVSHNRTWYGSPIINSRQSDWDDPSAQYNEDTPEIFKTLGRLLNRSPEVVEYLASQYTGFLGAMAIPALSIEDDGRVGGVDAIMNSITRKWTADPYSSSDVTNTFFDLKGRLDTIKDEAKAGKPQNLLLRSLSQEQVDQAYQEAEDMLGSGGIVKETYDLINDTYKKLDEINVNDSLTDAQKYTEGKKVKMDMLRQVQAANDVLLGYQKKYITGETLTDRVFNGIMKRAENGKLAHVKTDLERLPDTFLNDSGSEYMQKSVEVYNANGKSAALPHPSQSFTVTKDGVETDYEIPDDEFDYYTDIYKRTYESYIVRKGGRWDEMNEDQKYNLLKSAHSSANKAMRDQYIKDSARK